MYYHGFIHHPRIVSGFLNRENMPDVGVPLSTAQVSGSIVQPYAGLLGGELTLSTKEALALSYTTTGTLYDGVYKLVKFAAGSSPVRGLITFWVTRNGVVVTTVATAPNCFRPAGICLNTVTALYYGWIQCEGKASIQYSVFGGTPADGDLVVVDPAPANTANVVADGATVTAGILKRALGIALAVPVSGAIGLVDLVFLNQRKVFHQGG